MSEIEMRIKGIPAIVKVVDFVSVKGSFRFDAPSDADYYGYEDIDFEICDRRGRPAPWLQAKLSGDEIDQLESDLIAEMKKCDD